MPVVWEKRGQDLGQMEEVAGHACACPGCRMGVGGQSWGQPEKKYCGEADDGGQENESHKGSKQTELEAGHYSTRTNSAWPSSVG